MEIARRLMALGCQRCTNYARRRASDFARGLFSIVFTMTQAEKALWAASKLREKKCESGSLLNVRLRSRPFEPRLLHPFNTIPGYVCCRRP
jgi:hypothetical protein